MSVMRIHDNQTCTQGTSILTDRYPLYYELPGAVKMAGIELTNLATHRFFAGTRVENETIVKTTA